jgi:hypothetical protein
MAQSEYDRKRYLKQKAQDPNFGKKKYRQQKKTLNSNPEAFASNKYTKQHSKAIHSRNIPWRLDRKKTVKQIVESEQCNLSGRHLVFEIGHPDSPSIDRINSKRGYTKSNIQIVTSRVNQAKNDMTDEEFIQLCIDVARHHGY